MSFQWGKDSFCEENKFSNYNHHGGEEKAPLSYWERHNRENAGTELSRLLLFLLKTDSGHLAENFGGKNKPSTEKKNATWCDFSLSSKSINKQKLLCDEF